MVGVTSVPPASHSHIRSLLAEEGIYLSLVLILRQLHTHVASSFQKSFILSYLIDCINYLSSSFAIMGLGWRLRSSRDNVYRSFQSK